MKKQPSPHIKPVKPDVANQFGQVQALRPAVIDIEQAAAYLSLSESTIEGLERSGEFPKKRQLSGRRVGYLVREIDQWLESRPQSNQLPPVGSEFGRAGRSA